MCVTSKGSFVYALDNCRFTLPQELLTDSTLDIQLVLRSEDVVWKSAPCTFTLGPTLDGSGENVFNAVRTEERNKTTAELAESLSKMLTTATGEDYSGLSFDELLQVVTTLPPTQQEQELVEWAKHEQWIISRCKSMPAALNSEFYLTEDEQNGIITGEAAKYIDPESKAIKLPRYDTLNVPWDNYEHAIDEHGVLSSVDIDVSSGIANVDGQVMFGGATSIDRITLRGTQNIESMNALFCVVESGSKGYFDVILEETGVKDEDVTYSEDYWNMTFYGSSVRHIMGTPLDMSKGKTDIHNAFSECEQLREVRFVPRTILCGISFENSIHLDCGSHLTDEQHPGTLISILNGIRDFVDDDTTPRISIDVPQSVGQYCDSLTVVQHLNTGDWLWSEDYAELDESEKAEYGNATTFAEALAAKGAELHRGN